jgi:hypothetical protein
MPRVGTASEFVREHGAKRAIASMRIDRLVVAYALLTCPASSRRRCGA